jgi:FkbM family methyltransferase
MVRDLIRSAFRQLGYDIRRYSPETVQDAQLGAMLTGHNVDLVLDVGANTGQFAWTLRKRIGYPGRIVSFEPMAAAHEELRKAASGDSRWEIAPRAALGAASGSILINISGNSVSSSVLPMLDTHASAAPESRYVGKETVPLVTLDEAAFDSLQASSAPFLKIDTQGYEAEVLKGAPAVLAKCVGVQIEMSLVPLYAGQVLILDLWNLMNQAGLELWSMTPAFIDPRSGRLLQVDATFFRKGI